MKTAVNELIRTAPAATSLAALIPEFKSGEITSHEYSRAVLIASVIHTIEIEKIIHRQSAKLICSAREKMTTKTVAEK